MAGPVKTLSKHVQKAVDIAARDPQLQALMPDRALAEAIQQPGLGYQQIIEKVLSRYRARPALGKRAYDVSADPETGRRVRRFLPRFDTLGYFELLSRIHGLANTWRHDQHRVAPDDFVCILGFSSIDYVVIDLACVYAQAVSVPLQSNLAGFDLDGILTDTAPTVIAATSADLLLAAELAGKHPSVRSIIAFDHDERFDDDRENFAAALTELAQNRSRAKLSALDELVNFGDFASWTPLPAHRDGEERMAWLLHSSGSTGTPKGAILPDRVAQQQWDPRPVEAPVVRVSLAPLNHIAGRSIVYLTLARGGTVYFTAKPDLSELFTDIRLARPTELAGFPRIVEMIHRHYQNEVLRRRDAGDLDLETVRAEVMADMRHSFLGDRLTMFAVGAAPTTPEMKAFIRECFQVTFFDGYGSTEAGSNVIAQNRINRSVVTDYKLRDVPELGYFTTDKPYPRGELCVKTRNSIRGYFKRPDATANLFDEEGFIRTGDIMEERGPDHVVIIDRRNDVLKLSQGEYVAVGALGNRFEGASKAIQQMYAYGNSAYSYILAVIVPNMDIVQAMLGKLPSEDEFKTLLRHELKKVADAAGLKSFEVPRDFIIEREPFSFENGLLSSVRKRLRPALKARYGEALEQLYVDLERAQQDELAALRTGRSDLTVIEKLGKALEAVLGIQGIDPNQPLSFTDLGGDSLGAAGFSALLKDIFGVDLPVNAILGPTGTPRRWVAMIEAALSEDGSGLPIFAQIHGKDARQLNAADLDLSAFIDADFLAAAPLEPPAKVARSILLTGATGFLGRFVCLELLERQAAAGGKLFCLIRARDETAARERLAGAFAGADRSLQEKFRSLAADHLEVVVGDVGEARLGLPPEQFDRLAGEIDRIVHVAALVNHMLAYEDLFGPNVAGTAELVRFALAKRQKSFDFISSVATTWLLEQGGTNNEDTPLRQKVALSPHYGTGYGASKWAAEQLLHSAHRKFGLPINVFRGDMMLASRRYAGQINVPDIFTRLLYSVVMTGMVPDSFYQPLADGKRAAGHYDGLPVDFIAEAIAVIGAEPHREARTFHVINHYADDGMGLDQFVDWIEEAGYPVRRITDYREFVRQFEERLKALPEAKRQRSSLPVLDSLRQPERTDHPMVGNEHFVAAVERLVSAREVPHLDRDFILKCLADMQLLGLIPPPADVRSHGRATEATREL